MSLVLLSAAIALTVMVVATSNAVLHKTAAQQKDIETAHAVVLGVVSPSPGMVVSTSFLGSRPIIRVTFNKRHLEWVR
ncbi:MAG: hypothetical protein AB7F28_04550 [Candidatus Margulisiibacteriota bacterium]